MKPRDKEAQFASAWMYDDHPKMKRNSRRAWILCMTAGTGVTGWLFAYGYYANF